MKLFQREMPQSAAVPQPRDKLLSFEEISELAGIFTEVGIEKVRLTGGEPLLRKDPEVSVPAARLWLKFALAAKLCFISRWLAQAPLCKQTDYAFRRGICFQTGCFMCSVTASVT